MYHPVPLNWIAGDDSSRRTGPLPHSLHVSTGGSENFWITSNRRPHASHSYSYNGTFGYSSTASTASLSSRRRRAENGAHPCDSTASWKARSEYFAPCSSL